MVNTNQLLVFGLVGIVLLMLFKPFLMSAEGVSSSDVVYVWGVDSIVKDKDGNVISVVGSGDLGSGDFFIRIVPNHNLVFKELLVITPQAPNGLNDMIVGDLVYEDDGMSWKLVGIQGSEDGVVSENTRLIFKGVIKPSAFVGEFFIRRAINLTSKSMFGTNASALYSYNNVFDTSLNFRMVIRQLNTNFYRSEDTTIRDVIISKGHGSISIPIMSDELSTSGIKVSLVPRILFVQGSNSFLAGNFMESSTNVRVLPKVVGEAEMNDNIVQELQEKNANYSLSVLTLAFLVIGLVFWMKKNG